MSEERSSIIGPLLLGLAAGAALGLLLAPQSGRKTRKMLRKKARALRDQAGTAVEHGREAMSAASDRLSDMRQAKRDDLDDVARFLMDEGMHLWERVTHPATETETNDRP